MHRPYRLSGPRMTEQRAIIDIGSNTVRMVIYGGPPRAPVVLFNEKVTAKLGKAVADGGALSAKAMDAALAALGRYSALLDLRGILAVETVATAAVRDANNGSQFLESVKALGLKPRLLSGEEEALAGAQGVLAAFPGANGIVGDLGGGSLELTSIDGNRCKHGVSLPLGTLRLAKLRAADSAQFTRKMHRAIKAVAWAGDQGLPLYLVGGSWRALARYAMHAANWPVDDSHGFELAPDEALHLVRSLAQGKLDANVKGMSASRLASLPDAGALLGVLVGELAPSKLVFSSWGLREGLLYAGLPHDSQALDPMMAGIAAFAESHGSQASVAAMVTGWTANVIQPATLNREPLRLAATMLALAATQIEPNLRIETVTSWALGKRWIGLDAAGRALIVMAARANFGKVAIPDSLCRLAPEPVLREAVGWGLAIRLCRKLTGCSAVALSSCSLRRDDDRLVLAVRQPMEALFSDTVEKDLNMLAQWQQLEPQFQILPSDGRLR